MIAYRSSFSFPGFQIRSSTLSFLRLKNCSRFASVRTSIGLSAPYFSSRCFSIDSLSNDPMLAHLLHIILKIPYFLLLHSLNLPTSPVSAKVPSDVEEVHYLSL